MPTFTLGDAAPVVAVLGDSFVVGTGSTGNSAGWVPRVDALLDVDVNAFGQIGTGFVNPGTGEPYGARVSRVLESDPDYLLIQATLNDTAWTTQEVVEAAAGVFDTVSTSRPDLPVAIVGPIWLWSEDQADILRLRQGLAELAASRGIPYIDPTGWITDATASALIGPDNIHPNDDGYQVIANNIAPQIAAVFGLS